MGIIALSTNSIYAQISYGGEPYSFSNKLEMPQAISPNPSELMLNKGDNNKNCNALEFGRFLNLNISLNNDLWQKISTAKGKTIYRLRVQSKGALAVGAYFSDFFIPKGAELFIFSPDHQQLIGSFNSLNNPASGLFATEYILGDQLLIEYIEPANVKGQGHFIVKEILHAYRAIGSVINKSGFGSSDVCEVNVNCPEGSGKNKQRDAVLRLNIKIGSSAYWCTGSLINNTSEDRTPYVITADHCGKNSSSVDQNQWVFYFNYQSDDCDDPNIEPEHQTMTGCSLIAASSNTGSLGSDFYLVMLNQTVPEDYRPYFLGWNRDGLGSDVGYTIHHPQGDIKKISTYTNPLSDATYNGGIYNGFWEVAWSETETNHGVTEPGSSGSPIFDEQGYLIGTLTGGAASCSALTANDYYGKFIMHWDQNGSEDNQKLAPWLDPLNTGVDKMSGIYLGVDEEKILSGKLFQAIPNPVSSSLILYFDRNNTEYLVSISDLSGKIITEFKQEGLGPKTIQLEGLQKGIYIIKVMTESKTQISKFLKL